MSIAEADPIGLSEGARSDSPHFLRRLLRRKLAVVCVAYLLALVVVAIVAPIALPHIAGQQAGSLTATSTQPSFHGHFLGTDELGRDVLHRLLVGTRITLVGVAVAVLTIVVIGVPLGLIAGYVGGAFDRVVMWLGDLLYGMPGVVVVLLVLSVFPYSMFAAMLTFGVLVSPAMIRIVRVSVLPIKRELYIAAARAAGLSRPYIILRHVLPRVSGAIIVQASVLAGLALIAQSGLCFLGLLVKAPAPSWGGMVADGSQQIITNPWLIWPAGVVIALTVLALSLLGDVSRDALTEAWAVPVRRRRGRSAGVGAAGDGSVANGDAALLSVQGLKVGFESRGAETRVVDDVSFDIAPRETLGLVGESGCGKSATAMSIVGLLPGTGQVQAGSIYFGGRDLAALSERELHQVRGRDIAVISQEPMVSFNPTLRIGWQLAEVVRRHHHVSRSVARARVLELLAQVHLPDPEAVAASYPHELSGGMAQRVAIARALAGDPSLVIADEPTTALDVTVQAEILGLLRELQADRGMAILLITHDWGVVAEMCQRAVVLYAGQVIEQGPIIPLFQEPRHPYTKGLLTANPHGVPSSDVLPAIPGTVPQPGEWPVGCRFQARCPLATSECGDGAIPLDPVGPRREARCIHSSMLERASA